MPEGDTEAVRLAVDVSLLLAVCELLWLAVKVPVQDAVPVVVDEAVDEELAVWLPLAETVEVLEGD